MIRTLAFTHELEMMKDVPLNRLDDPVFKWYWVDFTNPTEQEARLLDSHFHFHPLAVEDCMYFLQRPKLDHYTDSHFFVLHSINQKTLEPEELDMFLSDRFVVTFHFHELREIEEARHRVCCTDSYWKQGPLSSAHLIMDKMVDYYFPSVHQIEDDLLQLEFNTAEQSVEFLLNEIFMVRRQLLKLRRSILPMRDLLYRIINSNRFNGQQEQLVYFTDIHDHLLKLSEIIESNREMTADIRDSYISLNSNRMNTIMKTLTVITTIFMPLTFIVGLYGMNFEYMPELKWHYGYFLILAFMAFIGIGMYIGFRKKGWFK